MRKLFFTFTILITVCCQFALAQNPLQPGKGSTGRFTVGERLTYNISFASYGNAAFAETYVVSQGKYADRDAVMLQGKLKTTEFVNAAFFGMDETRQTLVSPETGLPMFCKKTFDENGMAREKTTDLRTNTSSFDWLSAIYHLRFTSNITGNLTIQEGTETFQITWKEVGKSHNKTGAGEFDTTILAIENPTFPGLQIYISNDDQRLPVVLTYKHAKGMFRAELAGIQDLAPAAVATAAPRSTPIVLPAPTPKPQVTPTPYQNNQPLNPDLPFILGETLTYRLSRPGVANPIGTMIVQAKERREFSGKDSLLLMAVVPEINDANSFFIAGDTIKSYVDPDSLLPRRTEMIFKGALSAFNQTLTFDQIMGKVNDSRAAAVDIPVGTHDLLSLAYAVRSFNVKDIRPSKAPALDTRVALFGADGPVILTILPQAEETIDFQGKKMLAQVILTNVGQNSVKLWLSKDPDRLPLRLSVTGPTFSFNADLISVTQNPPAIE